VHLDRFSPSVPLAAQSRSAERDLSHRSSVLSTFTPDAGLQGAPAKRFLADHSPLLNGGEVINEFPIPPGRLDCPSQLLSGMDELLFHDAHELRFF